MPWPSSIRTHADDYRADVRRVSDRAWRSCTEYAKEQLATVPRERRVLVTAHDAFRYFGRAYDVEVRGIQGISTDSEAGVQARQRAGRFSRRAKDQGGLRRNERLRPEHHSRCSKAAQPSGHAVAIGGELFSDAMGNDGTPEGTYEGMVQHNVDTIVNALK